MALSSAGATIPYTAGETALSFAGADSPRTVIALALIASACSLMCCFNNPLLVLGL